LLDGVETFVHEVLNANDLDDQQGMFKLMMKSNVTACMVPPFDTNPLTRMWCLVTTSRVLVCNFPEYVTLQNFPYVECIEHWREAQLHYYYDG
jgi:hypothetical protein